jgi:multidrug efflux pump subunit AcrA (membrane-fusion protein)
VNKGQTLAHIRDTEFLLAVEQADGSLKETLARLGVEKVPPPGFDVTKTSPVLKASAELDSAEANWKRMKTLLEGTFVSAQDYESAETRYKTARAVYQSTLEEAKASLANARMKEAQLRVAREKLKHTAVEAPLAGSVNRRLTSLGEYVKVGTPLFSIVQDHPLKLRGMIPERFAPRIEIGQKIEVRIDAFPGRTFQGQLTRISPAAEVVSRSCLVEGRIENAERLLKSGFFARGSIFTHFDPSALTVPQQALVTFAGITKVFVVENDVVRERVVEAVSAVGNQEVEIQSGLKPGELIAVSGLTRLTDGAPVKVSGPVMPKETKEEKSAPR